MHSRSDAAADADAPPWAPVDPHVLLQAFFDSPGAMRGIIEVVADDDVRHLAGNAATAAFLGVAPDALGGKHGSELGDQPQVLRRWVAACRESERTNEPVSFEYLDRRGSRDAWVQAVVTCLGTTAPGRARFSYIANDATERRNAEEALRKSEQRFRVLVEHVNAGVALIDETGRFSLFNRRFLGMFGLSADSDIKNVNDQDWAAWRVFDEQGQLLHVDDHPVRKAVLTGRPVRDALVEVEPPGGTARTWMLVSAAPLLDESGRPARVICTYSDITERKRLEEALRQTVSALEHANRVKDEFLATLSHELRTPLNAILGWSDMLLRAGLPPEVQRKALESVRRNAQAQAALISDILDVSRIITGKLRLDIRPVDLADVVAAACEAVQPAADARCVAIVTSIEGRPILLGDADRLQQIVWNLLSNSVRFSGHGGRVEVAVRPTDSCLEIEVRDEGAGIAADFLPHVFERFRQRDSSTTRRQGGLGLGLAIVRSLAELHGGTVAASSEGEGKGATFTVRLPVRAVFENAAPAENGPLQAPAGEAEGVPDRCLEGLHIVAVDDEEEARSLVRAVLERYAARVTTCSTAEEALAAVARDRPDLLLADVGMPGCDGYELIRRVRALPGFEALPAVALTAYGGAHDRAQALSAGFWQHLAKPVLPAALVRVVAAAAAARR